MQTRYFRGKKLIDRDSEINFFLDWFNQLPELILWVYGPKSSGKTTLIEYVVEKELFEDFENLKPKKGYWVRYINLRGKLITSYNSFLESFIKPKKEKEEKKTKSLSAKVSASIIQIEAELLKEVKTREKDLFDVIISEIEGIKAEHRILIIDEIQTLEDIYINGDRELLKEFLNFCVRLTKETHLSHVVILSSNTIFINRIYSDAKLKKTSRFYKIDHLDKSIVVEWLSGEGFKDDEIELIWDYLGGCIPDIQRMMFEKKEFNTLEEYLEHQAFLAYSQIVMFYHQGKFSKEEIEIFENICKEILANGSLVLSKDKNPKYLEVISKWAEKEILFFDPLTLEVKGNSRIYEKGMEKLKL